MLDRRRLLLALGAAAPFPAAAAEPPISSPPLYGDDPYGLKAKLGTEQVYFDRALRELNEPPLLPADAKVEGPTFRLVELRSFHKPRCSRVTFNLVDGSATALQKLDPVRSPAIVGFGGQSGLRLRVLLDDLERFWDAAPVAPDWDRLQAEALGEVLVRGDGRSTLLEGRVGAKRHAVVRTNPPDGSLLAQASAALFTTAD